MNFLLGDIIEANNKDYKYNIYNVNQVAYKIKAIEEVSKRVG